jgi:hypothetical protein
MAKTQARGIPDTKAIRLRRTSGRGRGSAMCRLTSEIGTQRQTASLFLIFEFDEWPYRRTSA